MHATTLSSLNAKHGTGYMFMRRNTASEDINIERINNAIIGIHVGFINAYGYWHCQRKHTSATIAYHDGSCAVVRSGIDKPHRERPKESQRPLLLHVVQHEAIPLHPVNQTDDEPIIE
jgi:hypothetical protein